MRDIKFRGLSEDKYVYGTPHYNAAECRTQIVEFRECPPTMSDPCGDQYNEFHNVDFVEEFTGLKDTNGNDIYEGDIIEHGNFYHWEGSSEDIFGTEPQVSWHVIEAYPERVKNVVVFENGAFRLKTLHFKSGTKERYDYGLLSDFINNDWKKVRDFAHWNEQEHKDNLEAGDFETTEDMINYLKPLTIVDNLNSFEKAKAGRQK